MVYLVLELEQVQVQVLMLDPVHLLEAPSIDIKTT
jgi:hypothetical protein